MFGARTAQDCEATVAFYAEVFGGFAFKSTEFLSDGVPIIRISDIDGETVNTENAVCYPEDFWDSNPPYRVQKEDVLMAMSGATTGKTGIVRFDGRALLNQRVACIRCKRKEYIWFLLTALKLDWMGKRILSSSPGSAQPNISGKQIENLPLPKADVDAITVFSAFAEQSDKSKAVFQKRRRML